MTQLLIGVNALRPARFCMERAEQRRVGGTSEHGGPKRHLRVGVVVYELYAVRCDVQSRESQFNLHRAVFVVVLEPYVPWQVILGQ